MVSPNLWPAEALHFRAEDNFGVYFCLAAKALEALARRKSLRESPGLPRTSRNQPLLSLEGRTRNPSMLAFLERTPTRKWFPHFTALKNVF